MLTTIIFVNAKSNLVEEIIRSDIDLILRSRMGAALDPVQRNNEEFWEICREADLEHLWTSDYELWRFNWESEDDSEGSGADFDPDDGLVWELPIIQRFLLGEAITVDEVAKVAEFLGWGVGFGFHDLANEFKDFDSEISDLNVHEETAQMVSCPSCGALAPLHPFDDPAWEKEYVPKLFDPKGAILWSDGVVTRLDEGRVSIRRANELGDVVVKCERCDAVMINSSLQDKNYKGLDDAVRSFLPGNSVAGESLTTEFKVASASETLEYLLLALEDASRTGWGWSWEAWTAAQQLINQISADLRARFFIDPKLVSAARSALKAFLDLGSGMLEGTLNYIAPESIRKIWTSAHSQPGESRLHAFDFDEGIPIRNMHRIVAGYSVEVSSSAFLGVSGLETSGEADYIFRSHYHELIWSSQAGNWLITAQFAPHQNRA